MAFILKLLSLDTQQTCISAFGAYFAILPIIMVPCALVSVPVVLSFAIDEVDVHVVSKIVMIFVDTRIKYSCCDPFSIDSILCAS